MFGHPVSGTRRSAWSFLRLMFNIRMFEIAVAVAEETRPWAKRGGSFLFALLI
jgi:hypothetical protein